MNEQFQSPVSVEEIRDELSFWWKMKQELANLRNKESLLRKTLFQKLFPSPTEGTNTFDLPENYAVKGQYPFERNVDEAMLNNFKDTMEGGDISVDKLINWKPSLNKKYWNTLNDDQKALVENILITKPGSISMDIVQVKRN